jgi:hypothetical protein
MALCGFQLGGFNLGAGSALPNRARLLLNKVPGASALYMPDRKLSSRIINGVRVLKDAGDPKPEADFSPAQIANSELLTFLDGADGKTPILYDWSGNGNHATQTTVADQPFIATAGVLEEGLRFAGGQFLEAIPAGSTFMQGNLTITAWLKVPTGSAESRPFASSNTGSTTVFAFFTQREGTDRRILFQIRNHDGSLNNAAANFAYPLDEWFFLKITKTVSSTTANWLATIDGVTIASFSQTENYRPLGFFMPLGAGNNRGTVEGFYTGNIGAFGLWQRVLTANEIATVKNLTDPTA